MRTQKAPLCSSAASLNGPSVCPEHKPLLVPLTTLLTLAQTLGRKRLFFLRNGTVSIDV